MMPLEHPNDASFTAPCSSSELTQLETFTLERQNDEPWFFDLKDDKPVFRIPLASTAEFWDDPEPLAEYDPDLSEPLYPEDTSTGLSRTLRIGAFISTIEQLTESQRQLVTGFLEEFFTNQLRNWLRWLYMKDWNGTSLILFLEFHREYWLETSAWWELTFWSTDRHRWISRLTPYALSRDEMYDLIQCRIDFTPSEVIDWSWLDDWNSRQMWMHGFYSFAKFALFRSKIHPGESWTQHINLGQHRQYVVAGFSENAPEALFASGDWYDLTEWEDGLS